jgi:preprotein translocase subunit YajC
VIFNRQNLKNHTMVILCIKINKIRLIKILHAIILLYFNFNFDEGGIMSLFPSAYAAETAAHSAAGGFNIMQFAPMIVIFVLFWFLLIRPQQKKAKLHSQMISALQKGDEVITNSGIVGKIVKINEQFMLLEVANNVTLTVQKSTVGGKVESGTLDKALQNN